VTVRFTNTVEDVVAWNEYRLFRTPAGRRHVLRHYALVVVGAWLVVCALLWWLFTLGRLSVGAFALTAATVLAGYAAVAAVSARRSIARQTRKLTEKGKFPRIKGEIAVTPRADGWHGVWEDGEVLRKWGALSGVTQIDGYLVLNWGEADFSLVPTRAFATVAERESFLAEVERHRAASVAPENAPLSLDHAPARSVGAADDARWYRDRYAAEAEADTVRTTRRG
jgi:hypothetical protein